MKIKIKTFNGELPDYLTEGKEYEIEHIIDSQSRCFIYIDECDEYFLIDNMNDSACLNGGSWEIINE